MAETLNIYQKLAKIRRSVEVMQRTKSGYGYKYVPEDEILAKISVFMDKYDISLIPAIVGDTIDVVPYRYSKTKSTKDGKIYEEQCNEVLVHADTVFTWVNNENPEEKIVVGWALVGQQGDASQAFGSGLTYSNRYFLLKYFNIATPNDDPDNFRSKQKQAELEEQKMVAADIISAADGLIRSFLSANPDKTEEVKAFAAKYAKGGNYLAIKEATLASRFLSEFKETFQVEI